MAQREKRLRAVLIYDPRKDGNVFEWCLMAAEKQRRWRAAERRRSEREDKAALEELGRSLKW